MATRRIAIYRNARVSPTSRLRALARLPIYEVATRSTQSGVSPPPPLFPNGQGTRALSEMRERPRLRWFAATTAARGHRTMENGSRNMMEYTGKTYVGAVGRSRRERMGYLLEDFAEQTGSCAAEGGRDRSKLCHGEVGGCTGGRALSPLSGRGHEGPKRADRFGSSADGGGQPGVQR